MNTNSVIEVGDGRGFVVEGAAGTRYVITAAHCLPNLPAPHGLSYTEERTYPNLLGRLGEEPSVWAECVFVDPVADIAVLSEPDNQALSEQAEAYEALAGAVTPFTIAEPQGKPIAKELNRLRANLPQDMDQTAIQEWVMHECPARLLSLDNQWFPCAVRYLPDHALMIENASRGITGGMSGSPIVAEDGTAIGIVCLGEGLDPVATKGGPNPRLMNNLPGWLLKRLTALPEPEYVREFRRWQNAPAGEKDRIAIEVALRRSQPTGPDYARCPDLLGAVAPNGKLLGDCHQRRLE